MIILPPDTVSAEDIKKLEKNDICIVICKDPSKFKFIDPIPAISNRSQIESAAITLSRCLLNGSHNSDSIKTYTNTFAKWFVEILIEGTPLDSRGSYQEREEEYFNQAKREELARLGREEAKQERASS